MGVGIGKTHFLNYLTWRLQSTNKVSCIIREFPQSPGLLNLANDKILRRADLTSLGPDASLSRWILFDSTKNGPPVDIWPAVLVTSPKCVFCLIKCTHIHAHAPHKRTHTHMHTHTQTHLHMHTHKLLNIHRRLDVWKQFDKQDFARHFVMPVWSHDELSRCRPVCFPLVTPETMEDNFKRWYAFAQSEGPYRYVQGRNSPLCACQACSVLQPTSLLSSNLLRKGSSFNRKCHTSFCTSW